MFEIRRARDFLPASLKKTKKTSLKICQKPNFPRKRHMVSLMLAGGQRFAARAGLFLFFSDQATALPLWMLFQLCCRFFGLVDRL